MRDWSPTCQATRHFLFAWTSHFWCPNQRRWLVELACAEDSLAFFCLIRSGPHAIVRPHIWFFSFFSNPKALAWNVDDTPWLRCVGPTRQHWIFILFFTRVDVMTWWEDGASNAWGREFCTYVRNPRRHITRGSWAFNWGGSTFCGYTKKVPDRLGLRCNFSAACALSNTLWYTCSYYFFLHHVENKVVSFS